MGRKMTSYQKMTIGKVRKNLPEKQFTAKELAKKTHSKHLNVANALRKMEKEGEVQRIGYLKQDGRGRPAVLFQKAHG